MCVFVTTIGLFSCKRDKMKALLAISIFLLLRTTKCEEPEFYNILKESIDATSSDNFIYTDGMDGYAAPELIEDRPITIPINQFSINNKTLSSPYIIDTIFKLQTDNSSCLFKIMENETTKLGICFTPSQRSLMRINLDSDGFEPVVFLIANDLLEAWTTMLFLVDDKNVTLMVNCSDAMEAELKEKPKDVTFSSDAVLSLGHSATGLPFTFLGAIQQIKIYPESDSNVIDTICSTFADASPAPAERGEKGDKGDSIVGPMGPQGPPGPMGLQGLQGEKGTCECSATNISEIFLSTISAVKGMPGPIGPPGADGSPGLNGTQGPKGDNGLPGEKGNRGEKGDSGLPGTKGDPGVKGEAGLNGTPGPVGPPGSACNITGLKGSKGESGDRGEPGIPGKNGKYGDKGDKGDQGTPGPPGQQGNFSLLLEPDVSSNDLKAIANKLKDFCEPNDHGEKTKTVKNVVIEGPQGLKGDKGDIGPKGAPGTKGPKGDRGTISKMELKKLRGAKGERGERGLIGPPGPPGSANTVDALGSSGPPGPSGPPGAPGSGPRGRPGVSIVGPKGEPGKASFKSIYEKSTVDINHDDYVYVAETVVFKSTKALFKRTESTVAGTLAFVRQTKTLVIRVDEGWQQVMLGSLLEDDSFKTLSSRRHEHPLRKESLKLQPTPKPNKRMNLDNGYIRIAALNTPQSGKILHNFNESRFSSSDCQHHALQAGLRDGPFLPFLSEREPVNYLRSKVLKKFQKYPVVNLNHEVLFESYEGMLDGSGAELAANHPPIYSFNGKDVFTHPDWPTKAIWHGSDARGHPAAASCDSFQSDNPSMSGMGSPLAWRQLLAQERYSCDNRLIVLCVDFNGTQKKKKLSRRKSIYTNDVDIKSVTVQ